MSSATIHRLTAALAAVAILALAACGGGSGGGGVMSCTWTERTSGCGGTGWSSWSSRCDEFNPDDYYISPQEHCANMGSNDTSCAGSCCIYIERADAQVHGGGC